MSVAKMARRIAELEKKVAQLTPRPAPGTFTSHTSGGVTRRARPGANESNRTSTSSGEARWA